MNNLLKIKYINLDRRLDRKVKMEEELEKHNLNYERFSAYDGIKLKMTNKIKKMFANNSFSWRRSIVGCALSHISLWRELAQSNYQYYMILEDDIQLDQYFYKHFGHLSYILSKTTVPDIVLMGYTTNVPYINHQNPPVIGLEDYNNVYLYRLHEVQHIWGGLFGYIINKNHAINLLKLIDDDGMNDPIDNFIIKNTKLIYMTNPPLVKTDFVFGHVGNGVDSDIQYDFMKIDDDYDFYEQLDSYGDDIKWVPADNIEDIRKAADAMTECVAFNTYGFLKKNICTPNKFIKFGNSKLSGLYVKKMHPNNTAYRDYINSNIDNKVLPTL